MYELIAFICGAAVMILELAGVRIISPFMGSTHVIYTSIIGVIMASLSFGYWLGGRLSLKNPSCVKLSIVISAAGLYILLLAFVQFDFLRILLKLYIPFIVKSVIGSIIMFTLPSVLLGIVSPYIIQLAQQNTLNKNAGSLVGRFYSISTIGSIFGTFLCGFYLIITFGIDRIFFTLSLILFLCAILCLFADKNLNSKKKIINSIYILFSLLSFISLIFFSFKKIKIFPQSIYNKTTPYNYISVLELRYYDGNKIILLNNKFSASYKNLEPDKYFANYIKMFHNFFINKKKHHNNLILGNATGSLVAGLIHYCDKNRLKNITFDIVEIDKEFTEVGEKYFNLPKNDERIKYFYEDARTFLNVETNKKYDIVFYDIYISDSKIVPYYIITQETYNKINEIMDTDGILLMNIIGDPYATTKEGKYVRQIYTNIKSVFPDVRIYKTMPYKYSSGNYIICAYKNPKDTNTIEIQKIFKNIELKGNFYTDTVFTDNFSPVEKFLEY